MLEKTPQHVRLANALNEAKAPTRMWERASMGFYDDVMSPLPFPKIALIDDLRQEGMREFEARVMAGEFDSTAEDVKSWLQHKSEQAQQWRKICRA